MMSRAARHLSIIAGLFVLLTSCGSRVATSDGDPGGRATQIGIARGGPASSHPEPPSGGGFQASPEFGSLGSPPSPLSDDPSPSPWPSGTGVAVSVIGWTRCVPGCEIPSQWVSSTVQVVSVTSGDVVAEGWVDEEQQRFFAPLLPGRYAVRAAQPVNAESCSTAEVVVEPNGRYVDVTLECTWTG